MSRNLRCGLASDIEVIDGFPSRVNSYMLRLSRWTRGDWQIISWLFKGPLNSLSKYKIFDNLRRSLLDIFLLALFFVNGYIPALFVIFFPFILDLLNVLFCHRSGKKSKKNFVMNNQKLKLNFQTHYVQFQENTLICS